MPFKSIHLIYVTPLIRTYVHAFMRLITGVSLVLLLSGPDAMNTLYDYITQNNHFGPESVFTSSTENQVNNLSDFIFGFSAGNDKGKLYIRFLDLNTVSRFKYGF